VSGCALVFTTSRSKQSERNKYFIDSEKKIAYREIKN